MAFRANESKAWSMDQESRDKDRALFIKNLGWLLSQTRNQVESCYMLDRDMAVIKFVDGSEVKVNIACDSYMAIIQDVNRQII